jgi:hypothetical protein
MKRRKLTAILLAITMALTLSGVNVFAAGGFDPDPVDPDREIGGNVGPLVLDGNTNGNILRDKVKDGTNNDYTTGMPIPVLGYVGPAKTVVDTDPKDPEAGIDGYLIEVSVPVKIIWAAFEENQVGGTTEVDSPEYSIKNVGSENLKVTVNRFASTGDATVNSSLTLTFKPIGTQPFAEQTLFASNAGLTPEIGSLNAGVTWNFEIDGAYTGGFTTTYEPTYDLELKFELTT